MSTRYGLYGSVSADTAQKPNPNPFQGCIPYRVCPIRIRYARIGFDTGDTLNPGQAARLQMPAYLKLELYTAQQLVHQNHATWVTWCDLDFGGKEHSVLSLSPAGALDTGGVGALELVAMDMKARGMYVCRTLSYKGAEFEVVEAPLEAEMMVHDAPMLPAIMSGNARPNRPLLHLLVMNNDWWEMCSQTPAVNLFLVVFIVPEKRLMIHCATEKGHLILHGVYSMVLQAADLGEMYTRAAEFWAELRVELLSASACSEEKRNPNPLWRLYWASHQRFFRHMCMSAKVPAAVRLAKQALTENKCVVIGLQSTGEARTEEAVTKYPLLAVKQGLELDDFVSGPRELLIKLVEENYPLPPKPDTGPGEEESVKELQRKRHSATPNVSFRGRVRKVAKWKAESDNESDEESLSESDQESTESDEEFQFCEICSTEEFPDKFLKAGKKEVALLFMLRKTGSSLLFKKTDEYLEARQSYVAELLRRYEAAMERKTKILEIIRSLDLPNNPLDDIIDQLGGPDNVAEMTGRRGMLVRASSGKGVVYQARSTYHCLIAFRKDVAMEMVNMNEKQLFMDEKKLVAIISEAGSAGVSLQADRRAKNQRRRVHLTLELPWSADRAIQQFGRTHRSNQASAPEYRLLFTNLGGERRFASIVAKRLETLGALTQGDRRAGPSLSAYNYDSNYGKKALMMMYKGVMEQASLPVVPPGCSSEKPETIQDFIVKSKAALVSVGIVRDTVLGNGMDAGKVSGRIVESDMHDVGRFLNRLLGLPPDIQNRLFELFISILDLLVRNARNEGNFDSGIVDIKANLIEQEGPPKTVHVDHMSGAPTVLFTFMVDRGLTWDAANNLLDEKRKDGPENTPDGFYESRREWFGRRHFLLAYEGEMPSSALKSKYRKVSSLDKARKGWEEEYEESSKQCMHGPKCKLGNYCTVGRRLQEVNVLGGLILPVWGTIEKALSKQPGEEFSLSTESIIIQQARQSHRRLRVVRLETTTDNQRIVGLLVPNVAVESVLHELVDALPKKAEGRHQCQAYMLPRQQLPDAEASNANKICGGS
ncbi:udp-glycosyltransferase [Asimina triloba]